MQLVARCQILAADHVEAVAQVCNRTLDALLQGKRPKRYISEDSAQEIERVAKGINLRFQ